MFIIYKIIWEKSMTKDKQYVKIKYQYVKIKNYLFFKKVIKRERFDYT